MKILMLSTDLNVLRADSAVRARLKFYAQTVEELIVVVTAPPGLNSGRDGKLQLFSTNSSGKLRALWNLWRVANNILANMIPNEDRIILSAQDPFEIGLVGWLLKKRWRLPLQLQLHTDAAAHYFVAHHWLNSWRQLLAKFLLPRAEFLRVVSARVRAGVRELVPSLQNKKITVLPVWVDEPAILPPAVDLHGRFPEFDFIFLVASRLTTEKNILAVAKVLEKLRAEWPRLGLVIVGDGPEKNKLRKFSFVRLLGWSENILGWLRGADIFVNNSWYEGYGRTLVEAAMVGVPIITTDVGVATEVVLNNKNGLLLPPGNNELLEQALRVCLEKTIFWSVERPHLLPDEEYLRLWRNSFE